MKKLQFGQALTLAESIKLKELILSAIKQEDEYQKEWTEAKAISYAQRRFLKEKSWEIERTSMLQAAGRGFQGIALHVPIWDSDIEELGFDPEKYWVQLAHTFLIIQSIPSIK